MTKIDDGGPAFPQHDSGDTAFRPGMTLRDWFAGQALAGLAAAGSSLPYPKDAESAYLWADAMIEARKDHTHD